jgi:hypothetical protein
MTRDPMTLNLYRENRHIPVPSLARDVWEIVKLGILGGLVYAILILMMA